MELYKPFDFLTADECQEIILHSKTHGLVDSKVEVDYKTHGQSYLDKKIRKSKQFWLHSKKYNKKILDLFKTFDKKLILDDSPDIIFYEPGDFYGWHTDHLIFKKKHWFRLRDFERVLSLTVELQPANNSGLYFDYRQNPHIPRTHDYKPVPLKQGQAIAFTSKDLHRVANAGKETRISLVAWGSSLVK